MSKSIIDNAKINYESAFNVSDLVLQKRELTNLSSTSSSDTYDDDDVQLFSNSIKKSHIFLKDNQFKNFNPDTYFKSKLDYFEIN